ncbi:Glyoxylase, beta-lactamase superfamily II [Lishizhenia tianjinensis]|uniref:Glyoxylase, beta-lactamase superfamily II n=1 Tax=Lishizhenia tianjinensis TaxID=477690 RepID=A0A1I6ZXN5_9FLAO|nr:MBL fold metallo-hydrolase [Lishizhenia tianjinensis]SFT67419.1 Glyoxylase, beta-lactamase superfamily II [Lishizhenia tianjinensis]
MKIEQIYTKCMAEAAYYIESNGEAAIIDPLRETQPYIDMATENGAKIKYIFETHFHADFVSGHIDLAKKTGAAIVYGPTATTNYDVVVAEDNQIFEIGDVKIKVLHTPGHTPESSTFLLIDENGKEHAIFSGDTLFLGDVGRPDLAIKGDLTQEDLAGMLFDSLRNRIMPLGDDVIVYPGHGAGSSCGKNMSSETVGTLGEQKATNYALRADMTKEEFIQEVTTGILPPPQYFPKNARMNKEGYTSIDEVLTSGTKALTLEEFKTEVEKGALILDVRTQFDFIKGFIKGSMFIGINGAFAMWVGALIEDINQPIVLITPEGMEEETVLRLARVGYDNTIGYLKGGVETAREGGLEIETITSISAEELAANIDLYNVVDVRKPGEWESSHLEMADHYPLDYINEQLDALDKDATYHIHCAGGYRSVIAISILLRNGYEAENLIDVAGGYGAIKQTSLPKLETACANS